MKLRLGLSAVIFAGLYALAALEVDAFAPLVGLFLLTAPILHLLAFVRLRRKHILNPSIQSLRSAMLTELLLTIASGVLSIAGLFVVGRAIGILSQPLDRLTFLVILAFPLIVMAGPAVEWLVYEPTPETEATWPSA